MASRALKLFIETYGTCAGNLAVTTLPYGGFYIVGGIAPKLINQMCDGTFLNAFLDKGRMMGLLTDIPVYIVTNTEIGLQGAAYYAAHYL
jgi:glucokinase